MELRYIPFVVQWVKDEEFAKREDPLNITEDDESSEGICFCREDVIIGFNSGPDINETYLIIGLDMDGKRQQFKVHESITSVAKKLNGQS